MTEELTLRRPDDFHLHLRDGDLLKTALPFTARQFARAVVMPNLKPPVTTWREAAAYRERIYAALPPAMSFEPLMTCYLRDTTEPEELVEGSARGVFAAAKLYPAGATTHSEYGVTSIERVARVLDAMQDIGMPLLIHGEATEPDVDVFDREAVFIEQTLQPLLSAYPALKVVLEHITTEQAVAFIDADTSDRLAATITPQHLLLNRNAMFSGGLRPHHYCLPVLKRERHRLALRRAATSGSPSYFLGTDSAPHAARLKESACGCAGIFSAPVALEAYATVFDEEGALARLEAFASENGSRFYGLPLNSGTVILTRVAQRVAARVGPGLDEDIVPFMASMSLPWQIAAPR